jgi:hypothetical protein
MSLCILAAGKLTALAVSAFTLSWQHSVEHVGWQEDWQVTAAGLVLVEARVKGSGAGMDPGEGARLEGGWWRWAPGTPPVAQLVLAASGATGSGWTLCTSLGCRMLGAEAGPPLVLTRCQE